MSENKKKAKVYVITSGKGGVGKSTTTANISTALAKLGKKVLVVDADIGLRNLDMLLGLENRIVYDILDVVEGRVPPEKAFVRDKRGLSLYLLPANQTKNKDAISPEQMQELIEKLKNNYDFVDRIPKLVIPEERLLIALYVESMYTNIDHAKVLNAVSETLQF